MEAIRGLCSTTSWVASSIRDIEAPSRPSLRGRSAKSWGPWARLRVLRRALFPSAAELAAIYGAPRGTIGAVGLRLRRPFDAAARYVRARRAVAVE